MKKLPIVITLALVVVLVVASTAFAGEKKCRNKILTGKYDDVLVPKGKWCVLQGAEVKGNVKAESGASLTVVSTTVEGNVQGDGATGVAVLAGLVEGDVQIKKAKAFAIVNDAHVVGNVQLEENEGAVSAAGNLIEGDLQVFKGDGTSTTIWGNAVNGNLQCKENSPAPFDPLMPSNTVDGNAEDQCAGFAIP